jgi:glyceraldehyde 3-phosphate dehydrogenase
MQKVVVGVNGFGRIGRFLTRLLVQEQSISKIVINDLAPTETLIHLFKYDSVHGKFLGEIVHVSENEYRFNDVEVFFLHDALPASIQWGLYSVDVVVEATGKFLTFEAGEQHLENGAKRVIFSAPTNDERIPTVIIGVNDHLLSGEERMISNASCTTNSAAPMIRVMQEICEIESAYITTVHSYTTDQRLHDSPHKDLRRARAAAQSIVPTTTGAAKALTKIFPELDGKLGGCGMRVPVPDGSLTDLTMIVQDPPSIDKINEAFKKSAQNQLKGILYYTEDPIVSVDILGDPHSCVFDSELTSVVGNMVKVVGWYDNEAGYSNRLRDLILRLNK